MAHDMGHHMKLGRYTTIGDGPILGGRPLGLLLAWLAKKCDTRAEHHDYVELIEYKERFDARKAALDIAGFDKLLAKERQAYGDDELSFEPYVVAA